VLPCESYLKLTITLAINHARNTIFVLFCF
jgi:hypothetical protein